jgi:hypothetical protein
MRVKRVRGRDTRAANRVEAHFTSEPAAPAARGDLKCGLNAFVVAALVPRTASRRNSRPKRHPGPFRSHMMAAG